MFIFLWREEGGNEWEKLRDFVKYGDTLAFIYFPAFLF